ncbi:hypothetical protein C9975_03550 [Thalassospira xiamenensis]|nr:hypothetical protein C9975_03550 [Thalassospira xiamenensis]
MVNADEFNDSELANFARAYETLLPTYIEEQKQHLDETELSALIQEEQVFAQALRKAVKRVQEVTKDELLTIRQGNKARKSY